MSRLTDARAEIARLRAEVDKSVVDYISQGNGVAEQCMARGCQMRAPTGTDARETAVWLLGQIDIHPDGMPRTLITFDEQAKEVARAIEQAALAAREQTLEDAAQVCTAAYRRCIERASKTPDPESAEQWRRSANTYAQAAQNIHALGQRQPG